MTENRDPRRPGALRGLRWAGSAAAGVGYRWLRHRHLPFLAIFLLFLVALVRTAWIADDAMITLRTVHNFVNGHGLTWNPGARVQTYTHPLWMLALSGVYLFTQEPFFTGIFLSMAISVAAVLILLLPRKQESNLAPLVPAAILVSSKSFVDYASSGLETPMTFFLLALFLRLWQGWEERRRGLLGLAAAAGFLAFNRPDAVLLVLPCLGAAFWRQRSFEAAGQLLLGLSPIILWELFSLFYYGFPFPNTAYAKLTHGLPRALMVAQGLAYFVNSLRWDPLTLTAIVAGLAVLRRADLPVGAGVVLYLAFVLYIGGDHMSGRFFSAPLFISVHLIRKRLETARPRLQLGLVPLAAAIGLLSPYPPILSGPDYGRDRATWGDIVDLDGIADERAYFFHCAGLFSDRRPFDAIDCGRIDVIRRIEARGVNPIVAGGVGFMGFYAGPDNTLVDPLGVADPLLSRLPTISAEGWRPGHFARRIPEGYLESVRNGTAEIKAPGINAYYRALRTIIAGPLFSADRAKAILDMNLGRYDRLLPNEAPILRPSPPLPLTHFQAPRHPLGQLCKQKDMMFYRKGTTVDLGHTARASAVEIIINNDADFRVVFIRDGERVDSIEVSADPGRVGDVVRRCVAPRQDIAKAGYDGLHVQGTTGNYGCLSAIRLIEGCR